MGRAYLSMILLTLLSAACGKATEPINLPECRGATEPGARERFTFDQIVPCLSTISTVSTFTQNNVKYDVEYDARERGGNEYVPAALVYERGIDDADGLAILQCYFLERNGSDAFMIGLSIESPVGSNLCGVRNVDGTILAIEGTGKTAGPFSSFTELAKYYTDNNWMQANGTLRTIKASQVNQVTTDQTSPSVLELPWLSQEY